MKLKNFRRVAALGMAVGMTAVLAACGNTADTASSEAAESTAETAGTAEEASAETADAEYAYLADFSFSDAFDENGYLKGVTATDYVTLPDDYADITISADLGQVSDLLTTGPQTVLVIAYEHQGKPQERMIPFVSAHVDTVDLSARRITVDWQEDF